MGRKIDLLVMLRNRINILRKIEYCLSTNNISESTCESLLDYIDTVLPENMLEIILMDMKEAKKLEDWPLSKLRKLGQRLNISYWGRLPKYELILQIRYREADMMLYFPEFVSQEGEYEGDPTTDEIATKRQRRRYSSRIEAIRAKISEPFEHGTSFGTV